MGTVGTVENVGNDDRMGSVCCGGSVSRVGSVLSVSSL